MRACWAATLLVLVPPSPASCATCTGTSVVPRVLALTHRHRHKSPCVRQPFAGISGNTAFSSLWFLSRKLCPIFVCHFKGSLQFGVNPCSKRGFLCSLASLLPCCPSLAEQSSTRIYRRSVRMSSSTRSLVRAESQQRCNKGTRNAPVKLVIRRSP